MRPKRPRFAGVGERRRDMVDGVGYVGEDEIGKPTGRHGRVSRLRAFATRHQLSL
jgi:hypothetical protein